MNFVECNRIFLSRPKFLAEAALNSSRGCEHLFEPAARHKASTGKSFGVGSAVDERLW